MFDPVPSPPSVGPQPFPVPPLPSSGKPSESVVDSGLLSLREGVQVVVRRMNHAIAIGSRRFWKFLTSGVPALINTLSLFFESFTSRAKVGPTYNFRFSCEHIHLEKSLNVGAFHEFNAAGKTLLRSAESAKGFQILNRLINQREQAKAVDDVTEVEALKEKIDAFAGLLEKNTKSLSRKDLLAEDWAVLDSIVYELIIDFFTNLSTIFNTAWFKNLSFDKTLQEVFHTNYSEALIAENLALSFAYVEGTNGKIIPLPVFDEATKKYKLVEYQVQETTLGDNLPCYILESKDPTARPWVVVRGTQYYTDLSSQGKELRRGSLESILADSIDHKCIARHVINKTLLKQSQVEDAQGTVTQHEPLGSFFERWHRENKSVNLTGHSLGATLVNNLAVEFYDDIHKAYAFSGAGVSKKIAKRWDLFIDKTLVRNNLPAEARDSLNAKLVNFDYEGDLIPSGGTRLIGMHLAIKNLAKRKITKMYECHVSCHLNNDFAISRVDTATEKKKWARHFCEGLRIATGRCFRFLLTILNSKQFPDWWLNRKVYKEAAYHHRIVVKERQRQDYIKSLLLKGAESKIA